MQFSVLQFLLYQCALFVLQNSANGRFDFRGRKEERCKTPANAVDMLVTNQRPVFTEVFQYCTLEILHCT